MTVVTPCLRGTLELAYATLFVTAFLAATLIPLPSELPLVAVVRATGDIGVPVLVATLGNYLGACTTYALARRMLTARFAQLARTHPRSTAWFQRYGAVTLLLSWVPVIGDVFVALAGAAAIRFPVFSLWVGIGKAARYAAVAWAVSRG